MYRNFISGRRVHRVFAADGFARDLMIAAILGAGPFADAFFVALRLPNQFRAIFGEGAFSSAYVPTYSRVLVAEGDERAKDFRQPDLHFAADLATGAAGAGVFVHNAARRTHRSGLRTGPAKIRFRCRHDAHHLPLPGVHHARDLAYGNAQRARIFQRGAFAPVLLNLFVMAFLAVAFLFPDAGVAASWGVAGSGLAQLVLLMAEARRRGVLERLALPRFDPDVRQFFVALGPAVIGSAGQQIAILGRHHPRFAFAHRRRFLDLLRRAALPIAAGVIGVAAGTVLLPEMSRLLAAGDAAGASGSQNRSIALTLALSAPFLVAFLILPEEVVAAPLCATGSTPKPR